MSGDGRKDKNPRPSQADEDADLFRKFLENDAIPDKDLARKNTIPPRAQKRAEAKGMSLDLHGKNLSEAVDEVDRLLSGLVVTIKADQTIRIITGKGRHSDGSGILVHGVYEHVQRKWAPYIKRIDSPPAKDLIEGLPVRGHFDVVIMRR